MKIKNFQISIQRPLRFANKQSSKWSN